MADQPNPSEKYRLFRNFMVNELGISRDDVREWTREAIEREVAHLMGQINVEGYVHRAATAKMNEAHIVSAAIARAINERIDVTVKREAARDEK